MGFNGILERILLAETASVENVARAMDNHSKVIINYHSEGGDEHTGTRVIEPVAYGLSKAGNPVLRAYQPYGDTTTRTPGWKLFRLDRISYWEETSSKFDRIPDFDMSELNQDGDRSMSTVFKTYSSTIGPDATGASAVGPKTKEKVKAAAVKGDRSVDVGASNLDTLRNGAIYADLDNNRKVGNAFTLRTGASNDNETGPRYPETEKARINNYGLGRDGSVENGDIGQEELDQARELVYNNGFSDYSHQYTDDEWERIEKDMQAMNATDRNAKRRDDRWERSTDAMFKNRKGSANRELMDMDLDDEDWFDFGN